jgi:hypothetical protein
LTGAFALARRPARGAAVALAATPVALLLAVSQEPQVPELRTEPASVPAVRDAAPAKDEHEPAASKTGAGAVMERTPAKVARGPVSVAVAGPPSAPATREVASVAPAPDTSVTVTHTDDGEDTPPLDAIQRCLDELTVSATYVGC